MDLKKLTDEAKQLVDKRGGTDSVKEDAEEVKDIFRGGGSLTDKAKEAAEALKDPGAPSPDDAPASPADSQGGKRPSGERGERKGRGGGEGGRHRHGRGGRP